MSQLAPEHLRELLRMRRDRHARTEMPKTFCEEQKKDRHERVDFVVFFGKSVEAPTSSLRRAANDAQGCGAPTNGRGPTGLDIPFRFAFLAVDFRQEGEMGARKKKEDGWQRRRGELQSHCSGAGALPVPSLVERRVHEQRRGQNCPEKDAYRFSENCTVCSRTSVVTRGLKR